MDLLRMVERVFYMLPELLAVFIAIVCIGRSTGTDSVLMIIGAALDLLSSIASIVLWEVVYDGDDFGSLEMINRVINYSGLLGRLLFFTGVLLFVLRRLPPRRPLY